VNERQGDPGQHGCGEGFGTEDTDETDRAWSKGVGQARDEPQPGLCGGGQRSVQAPSALEGRHEDQRRPESLDQPRRDAGKVAQSEERPHRKEVPVRLVLQLAEGQERVPQVEAPLQEAHRVDGEVELGVERRPPGQLQQLGEHERHQNHSVRHPGEGSGFAPVGCCRGQLAPTS
jgi:hypothetical protein